MPDCFRRLCRHVASPSRMRVLAGFALTSVVTPLAIMPVQPFGSIEPVVANQAAAALPSADPPEVPTAADEARVVKTTPEVVAEAEAAPEVLELRVQSRAANLLREARNAEERFIFGLAEGAQESQQATGVPASVTIAQAILESSWGRSRLSREAHNYFGVKAQTREGPAGVIYMETWEVEGGVNVTRLEPFRRYHNAGESLTDHGLFFLENRRYARAMAVADDPRAFARQINIAGYATDPAYASKLISLMDRYDLYQYDLVWVLA